MKGKKAKLFRVVMALVLAVALASVGVVQDIDSASADCYSLLRWSEIPIPDEDDYQLYPGSDVGPIAVSPDGETLFAAVFNESDHLWSVFKSTDGGYTWKETGFSELANPIVAVEISPNWENDGCLFVATNSSVYRSSNRGKTFLEMSAVPDTVRDGGTDIITSLDVALDENGLWTLVVGTYGATSDVYLLVHGEWVPQQVKGVGASELSRLYGVLDVAFSPNYADDGMIMAMVNAHASYPPIDLDITILRTETQTALTAGEVGNWNADVSDAPFYHNGDLELIGGNYYGIVADRVSLALADDFDSSSAVFAGLTAYRDPEAADGAVTLPAGNESTAPRGDAFRVDLVTGGMIMQSSVTDLNIRSTVVGPSETNVWSLDISGETALAYIVAGLECMLAAGETTQFMSAVHYSIDGGASWLPSFKPPVGINVSAMISGAPLRGYPIVVMAPASAVSGIAYCGTGGNLSGFWVSSTWGTAWNGRGLLDTDIAPHPVLGVAITDVAPSPNYSTDKTLFMVTWSSHPPLPNLWKTIDGGIKWDLIYSIHTLLPLPGSLYDKVELPPNYPDDKSVFLTGCLATGFPPLIFGIARNIVRSTDEGNLFLTTLTAPVDITAWDVVDMNTIFIGDATGSVYRTTDAGATWDEPDETEIPATATVTDIVVKDGAILVSTNQSEVYICYDESDAFEFVRVGMGPGAGNVSVAFDANYDQNDIIYAGLLGGDGQVWRFDLSDQYGRWQQINDVSINVSALECTDDGVLYAIDNDAGIGWRSVYPTASPIDLEEKVPYFEPLDKGLEDANESVYRDLEVVPGSNILFSIGGDAEGHPALWTFTDTLIKPQLDAPDDGAITGDILEGGTTARVVLSWNALEGAEHYQVQVARDEFFGTVVEDELWTEGTMVDVDLSVGTPYYWRVRAASPNETYIGGTLTLLTWEGAPLMSQWSDPRSFTTVLGPGSARPELESPIGGAVVDTLKPMFEWVPVSGATGYELQVATDTEMDAEGYLVNVVAGLDLTGANALGPVTAYQPETDLEYDTTHFWHMKAIGTGTESPWSATGSFTTTAGPGPTETPAWVWLVIAISAVLLIAVIVLIARTRRPV